MVNNLLEKLKELTREERAFSNNLKMVLNIIVNNYDLTLTGNLLFIKFVFGYKTQKVREISNGDKVVIEIPIPERNCAMLSTKWEKALTEDLYLKLSKVPFFEAYKTNGTYSFAEGYAYAVTFKTYPWINCYLEKNLERITDKITCKFTYDKNVANELEKEICSCIKSVSIIEDDELDDFLKGIVNRAEDIAMFGIKVEMGFKEDNIKKPTFIKKEGEALWTIKIPYCRFDKYIELFRKTSLLQDPANNKGGLWTANQMIMEEVIKKLKK